MKNYLLSATLLATGTWFILSEKPVENLEAEASTIQLTEEKGLKVQQAKMRRVHDSDLLEVPKIRPVADEVPISSYYGMRKHPIFKRRRMHWGVDFPAAVGTPVRVTAGGIVQKAVNRADSSNYGKHIVVGHDDVHSTLYGHLSKVFVAEGDEVQIGDTIGLIGNTGVSTNPHLHYEVFKNEAHVDPMDYIKK